MDGWIVEQPNSPLNWNQDHSALLSACLLLTYLRLTYLRLTYLPLTNLPLTYLPLTLPIPYLRRTPCIMNNHMSILNSQQPHIQV